MLQGGQPRSTNDALLIAFPFPATAGHEQKKYRNTKKSRMEQEEWGWASHQRRRLSREQGSEIPGNAECYGENIIVSNGAPAIKEIYTRETSIQLNPEESGKHLAPL